MSLWISVEDFFSESLFFVFCLTKRKKWGNQFRMRSGNLR